MILTILITILFFLAFIFFSLKGYKSRNVWFQFIAINSLIAGGNSLKEILPSNYSDTITLARTIIGFIVISIFIYRDFLAKKTADI